MIAPYQPPVTGPNHYQFNGKERDPESTFDYFGARYYGSGMGRFVTPDWADKPTAVPYAHFGNPQSLNLYGYVQNNPTTLGDPDGHLCDTDGVCTSEGNRLDSPSGSSSAPGEDRAQNTAYTATILGQKVPVNIIGGTADDRSAIRGRLDSAFGDINQHAGDLSASDVKTIHNIKSISVDDGSRTGVDVKTGAYNLKPGYVMAEGSSTAWIASTIAHDAYHVTQFQHGEVYNRQTAPRLEREANQFQMRVGAKFGLTPAELNYIRNDTHTLYNTPPY